MVPELFVLNRKVNHLFGVCVDIQNSARPLEGLAFEIELLARNGVVHSAKLDQDEGRPLSILTSYLSALPEEVAPIVHAVDEACVRLATSVASCTNLIRVYALLVDALAEIAKRQKRRVSTQSYNSRRALDELTGELLSTNPEATEARSIRHISDRARENLSGVAGLVQDAQSELQRVRAHLEQLRTTIRKGRYVAQCVHVEVARISQDGDRFSSFADRVTLTVQQLEERLGALGRIAREGGGLLDALKGGIQAHAK